MSVERYVHHGREVSVISEVKGQHREHCLCFQGCVHFKPGHPDNCPLARGLYANAVANSMVTPVYECPQYESE